MGFADDYQSFMFQFHKVRLKALRKDPPATSGHVSIP